MKILFLILALFSQTAFSKVLFCKQKYLPIKTEYTITGNQAVVKITAEKAVKELEIKSVTGLRGLVVTDKESFDKMNLKRGESVTMNVSFTKPEGQAFLVLMVNAITNSKAKSQSLPIPVGELSAAQLNERKKNIKSFPSSQQQKPGTNALESETKYHTMKLPEE
jgi:hypothetical protein